MVKKLNIFPLKNGKTVQHNRLAEVRDAPRLELTGHREIEGSNQSIFPYQTAVRKPWMKFHFITIDFGSPCAKTLRVHQQVAS